MQTSWGQLVLRSTDENFQQKIRKVFEDYNKLIRVERMYLSNTTLFDGGGTSTIYYIRYKYMFRRLTTAIFRLYMKYLVSSYTRLNMGCLQREVGGEVDTRSRMCHGGWEVWVRLVSANICISELIIVRSMVSYYVCCRNYIYIYIYIHTCIYIYLSYTYCYPKN